MFKEGRECFFVFCFSPPVPLLTLVPWKTDSDKIIFKIFIRSSFYESVYRRRKASFGQKE